MADEPDYYGVLGVGRDADDETIRLAYRRLARRYHPDIAGTGSDELMRTINAAYDVLGDVERRRRYDASRGWAVAAAAPSAPPAKPRLGTVRVSGGHLRRVATLDSRAATPLVALAASAGGRLLAAGALDGRITLWDPRTREVQRSFTFDSRSPLGVLQDVALSPDGSALVGWGFQMGVRVWQIADGRLLWSSALNGPSGAVDARLLTGPARLRLALPDAPAALSEDDPFRWVHAGRAGTSILTRPLVGPVDPSAAIPLHCIERDLRREGEDDPFRIQQRLLSEDGRMMLTVAAGRSGALPRARMLAFWDVEARSFTGAVRPRQVASLADQAELLDFPLTATPDLRRVALRSAAGVVRVIETGRRGYVTVPAGIESADALLALSPDGALLATAAGQSARLLSVHTGAEVARWDCAAEVTGLQCLPWAGSLCWMLGFGNGLVEVWG